MGLAGEEQVERAQVLDWESELEWDWELAELVMAQEETHGQHPV